MQSTHAKLIEALDRVEGFLTTNSDVVGGAITSAAYQNFAASRDRMLEHMKEQDAQSRGTRSSVAAKESLRTRLVRKHMRPIATVARTQLPAAPEIGALSVPPRNAQYGSFVAAGYGMARAARLHEATFLAAGLPSDFLDRLVAATDALKEGMNAKGQTTALRVRATEGLKKEGRTARGHLRVLDTLVRAAVEDNDALLAQWRIVRRVVSVATSPKEPEATPGSGESTEVPTQPLAAA